MDEGPTSPGPGPGPGGFASLPSPAPSNITIATAVTNTTTTTATSSGLPHPRAHVLRPGSAKEDRVRRYVEEQLLHVSRRYVKKYGITEPDDEVVGYRSMGELCRDVDSLINIVWLSGTPSLQIPYLLNIANEMTTWVTSFPPSPRATFAVLRKLDHCFASLLAGEDIDTHEALPGFSESGPEGASQLRGGMTRTDMVRCKSMVEQMRVVIVEVMSRGDFDEEDEEEDGEEDVGDDDEDVDMDRVPETGATPAATADGGDEHGNGEERRTGGEDLVLDVDEDDDDSLQMDVARVYENTLVKLGERLSDGGDGVAGLS